MESSRPDVPAVRGTRVLHVQKAKGIGGSERHIIDLCAGLRALGAESRVLWLEQEGHLLEGLLALGRARGVEAERMPIREPFDATLALRLRRRLLADPPDIVHLHLIHATLHGVLAAKCGSSDTVFSFEELIFAVTGRAISTRANLELMKGHSPEVNNDQVSIDFFGANQYLQCLR